MPALRADASSINLVWDASASSTAIGYVVNVGMSPGSYSEAFDVGGALSFAYSNAVDGQRYYFAVKSYSDQRVYGPLSNEVSGYSNAPPQLTNPGNQSNIVGDLVTLQLIASDPYGQPLTYSATSLPPGLTLTASTGFIGGQPTTGGTWSVTATASDGVLLDSKTFVWAVANAPPTGDMTAPSIAIGAPTMATTYTTTKTSVTLQGTASDNVGVTSVTWTTDQGWSGIATGTTTWSAASVHLRVGSNVIVVTGRDQAGNASSATLTVTRRRK